MRSDSSTRNWTGPPEEPQSWGTKGAGPPAIGFPRKLTASLASLTLTPSRGHRRAPRPDCRPRLVASSLRARGPAQRVAHLGTAGTHLRGPSLPRSSSPPFPLPAGPGTAPSARKRRAGEMAASRLHDGTQSPHICVHPQAHSLLDVEQARRARVGAAQGRDNPTLGPSMETDRPLKGRLQRGEPGGLLQVESRRAATIYLHIQAKYSILLGLETLS